MRRIAGLLACLGLVVLGANPAVADQTFYDGGSATGERDLQWSWNTMNDDNWDLESDATYFDKVGVPIPGTGVTVGWPNAKVNVGLTRSGSFVHSLHTYYEGWDTMCNWRMDINFTDAVTGQVYSNWFNVGPTHIDCTTWAERDIEVNSYFPPGKFTVTLYDNSTKTRFEAYVSHVV